MHHSSGIPNKAFCLTVGRYKAEYGASTVAAIHQIGRIWYAANASYWTSGTTFVDACQGTVDAARAIGFDGRLVAELASSWADVGVECITGAFMCNDNGTCDVDGGETCASCSEDCGSCAEECNLWKRLKCLAGIGDCSNCESGEGCGNGICDGDETDGNCAEDCGCAAVECQDLAPFGCFCDATCDDQGDCCDDVGMCS